MKQISAQTTLLRITTALLAGTALTMVVIIAGVPMPAHADGGAGGDGTFNNVPSPGAPGGAGFNGANGGDYGSNGTTGGAGGGGAGGGAGGNGFRVGPPSVPGGAGGTVGHPDGFDGSVGVVYAGSGGGGGYHGNGFSDNLGGNLTGGNGGRGGDSSGGGAGGAGGGAGGFGALISLGGSFSNSGVIAGGNGGDGGNSWNNGAPANGGNGGDGGIGIFFAAPGATFVNSGSISGGSGGTGGSSAQGSAGQAGAGGAGIVGSDLIVTNSGTISGGVGNNGTGTRADAISNTGGDLSLINTGTVNGSVTSVGSATIVNGGSMTGDVFGIQSGGTIDITNSGTIAGTGVNGVGIQSAFGGGIVNNAGAAISGSLIGIDSAGSLFVTNFGTISGPKAINMGGASSSVFNAGTIIGGTVNPDDAAIIFSGSDNTLTLAPGSVITGRVLGTGNNDTFQLGGTGTATFDVSQLGPTAQYRGFSQFNKIDSSIWILTGTPDAAQLTPWSINGGTLSVSSDPNLGVNNEDLSFNGGILRVTGTAFSSTPRNINWGQNGGGFDIADSANVFTVAQSLSGTGGLAKLGPGTLVLSGFNDYSGATNVAAGTLQAGGIFTLSGNSAHTVAAGATIDLAGTFQSIGSLAGAGTVSNSSVGQAARLFTGNDNTSTTFSGVITDGAGSGTQLGVFGTGTFTLTGANTYTGGTSICFCSTLQIGDGGTTGSIVGNVTNGGTLILNRSNDYTFAGIISDDQTDAGKVVQAGSGRTDLTGLNTYTGATTINAGTLAVNGSIASSSLTTVNAGGTLGGNGIVGNTTINGGTLSPGNSIGLLTVQGNLIFTAASSYMVEVSPSNADRVNVTGTATLGSAMVNANFAAGTYVARQYTILNATGGVSGTFNAVANTNLPSNFTSSLSYDANNAYLNLALDFTPPVTPPGGPNAPVFTPLNVNQSNVATTLVNVFNTTGGIPLAFGGLTPAGLTQVSGELGTGTQQATVDAMGLFLGLMTDPFVAGRDEGAPAQGGPFGYADEALGYAAKRRSSDALAAIYRKAPPPIVPSFDQRWRVWSAGFGGSQTTDGNATLGSNTTTSRIAAGAVGLDYRFSPFTVAGIALAGGGTNFSVANSGTGRSDLFQAGAFVRHTIGATYITAALAYGWQDVTTDRSVGADRLTARFNTDAFSGRVEAGHRLVDPTFGMGLTPYAAGQFTTISLPNYAETSGVANIFGLNYAAKDVTASRSELGLRSDKSFGVTDGIFTLRGRAAWAHNFNPDRSITATFQTLPGASFVVNGAAQARDAALVTASAEMKWRNNWAIAATFEGEFSDVTRSYAGKGVVRYAW